METLYEAKRQLLKATEENKALHREIAMLKFKLASANLIASECLKKLDKLENKDKREQVKMPELPGQMYVELHGGINAK